MLNDKIKGAVAGLLIGTTLTTGLAFAKNGIEAIQAEYSDIKIYMDGILLSPKDANGKTVEPFIYDGTTYLPVRAVGEAIGKQVSWDGATSSVYLGERPGQTTYMTDIMDAFTSDDYTKYSTENGKSFTMGGTKYTNGFVLAWSKAEAVFNLNGKYRSITLDMGHIDGSNNVDQTVQIFVDDRLVDEYEVGYDDIPRTITIPVNYGLKVKFYIEGNAKVGFGNIVLQ